MTCPACTAAQQQPDRDEFANGCDGCRARALAVIGVDQLGQRHARQAIATIFGARAEEGERLVREWVARLRQQKARAA